LDLSGKFRTDDDGDIVFNFGPKFGMKAKYNIDTLEWMLSELPTHGRADGLGFGD